MLIITIKQGKEKSLLERQPWVYQSAIERVDGKPAERMKSGATAVLRSSSGKFLARAAHAPKSQIRARVWTFDEDQPVDHALIKGRVQTAVQKRIAAAGGKRVGAERRLRLVIGDDDELSGLLVDWYGERDGYLICEFQSAGVDAWKVPIVQALIASTGCANVYERADELIRKGEGLAPNQGVLAGDEPPDDLSLTENGVRYLLDLKSGEKRAFR